MDTTPDTQALYRADAYLAATPARVLAHEPVETAPGVAGLAVLLDRTVFYAAAGGQPGDRGRLAWDGASAAVGVATKGVRPGLIRHVLEAGATPPPIGAEVSAEIDWPTRHRHMRMHTALHLLSVVLPYPVTGGAIGAERGRLDFDIAEPIAEREALEARLLALVAADHAVSERFIDEAELDANPGLVKTMKVQPPRGEGRIRLVRIGPVDGPVDLQPCGGTHVRTTGEIGAVRLGKIEKKGRQNRRVTLELV